MEFVHHLAPVEIMLERAAFIVSEAISDPSLLPSAMDELKAGDRGIGLLGPEFLRWEHVHRDYDAPEDGLR